MSSTPIPLRATTVEEAVNAFFAHLRYRKKAEGTLKQWRPPLRDFTVWAGDRSAASLATHEIEGFLSDWIASFEKRNKRGPSDHSIKNVIVALRSLYKYLNDYGLLLEEGRHVRNPMLPIEPPTPSPKVNDWLRRSEDEALLSAFFRTEDERIIVWFLRWTGLRLGEALSLLISDLDLLEGTVYVRKSKTARGRRAIPIADELRPRIRQWLTVLENRGLYKKDGLLFPSRYGNPWTQQYAEKIVRRVGERVEIERLTPHRLRRTFGSYLLNEGVRLEVVSKLLGHRSTQVTEDAYAELLDQTVRKEMLAALGGSTSH
jgi:integrase/recombinase XerD